MKLFIKKQQKEQLLFIYIIKKMFKLFSLKKIPYPTIFALVIHYNNIFIIIIFIYTYKLIYVNLQSKKEML